MAMKEGLIGRKRGMTQVFGDDGNVIQVSVVEAGPCTVVGIRTTPEDGYDALQIGFEPARKNVTKAMAGHYKKAGIEKPMRFLREVRLQKTEAVAAYQIGQQLTVDQGDVVDAAWDGTDTPHTATFVPTAHPEQWRADHQGQGGDLSLIVPDSAVGGDDNELVVTPAVAFPSDPSCGTRSNPCVFDGSSIVNSGLVAIVW